MDLFIYTRPGLGSAMMVRGSLLDVWKISSLSHSICIALNFSIVITNHSHLVSRFADFPVDNATIVHSKG